METYATYCPEDNKLRLYVGRVPREEFLKLRADGWICTPKQREAGGCDFVATWTPSRRDTAEEYSDGQILDEDQGPEDRAADRAERFGLYCDKRTAEATGHADRYDAGPSAHGYQSQARAERAASRHDRIGTRATDAWSKAEYWQRRTAGVISHALYKSTPGVRMGRIKELEAELRKLRASLEKYAQCHEGWKRIEAETDLQVQNVIARKLAAHSWDRAKHPRTGEIVDCYDLAKDETLTGKEIAGAWLAHHPEPTTETDWTRHLELRLAYENQMLEAQGGRAAFVEMEPGGWIGNRQVRKVNKSPATGRVVSVTLKIKGDRWGNTEEGFHFRAFNIERLPADAYRAPTEADKAALLAEKKADKAAAPKKRIVPLINPTDKDAERLQKLWNDRKQAKHEERNTYTSPEARASHSALFKPSTVCRITQAQYSANSGGTYSKCETTEIEAGGVMVSGYRMREKIGNPVCKIRTTPGEYQSATRVIIITDKPQKPLPPTLWKAPKVEKETVHA